MQNWNTPTPLYRDPIFDGCADPVVVYNHLEKNWWMFYTQRRANIPVVGVSGAFGTALGIASSHDSGKTWIYRGVAQGLEIDRGHNTFWAPEITYDEKEALYHMVVTYIRGVPHRWGDSCCGRNGMVHYTSKNLWDWEYQNFVFDDEHSDIIDACTIALPNGNTRMWYRDTEKNCAIYYTDTADFKTFTTPTFAVEGKVEGPNVFELGGHYWMIVDPLGASDGLATYRSDNLSDWVPCPNILGEDGVRPFDTSKGRHADVVVANECAYIFYFTQPYHDYVKGHDFDGVQNEGAICIAQVAVIRCKENILVCDRNENFTIDLNKIS